MSNIEKLLEQYGSRPFVASAFETPDFYILCQKLKRAMQKDIKENFPELEISAWNKGHFYISGFITRKSDGAIFYFSINDVRCWNVATSLVLYRPARHLKDCIGGANGHCLAGELLRKIATVRSEFIQ